MPLPAANTPWPPRALADIHHQMAIWDAWYTGNPEILEAAYQSSPAPKVRPSQLVGGLVGAVSRFWWGRPKNDPTSSPAKLHLPAAADIAVASADLLFSEAPTITPSDGAGKKTSSQVAAYLDDGLVTTLAEAAEISAALGGVYLRATWDHDLSPTRSFASLIHADAAIPTFRWGRLVAVTFWHVVAREGAAVWRHVETHETDPSGIGVVFHGLYEGTSTNLGHRVPLTEHPSTAGIPVDADSKVTTASAGLDVTYVPNQMPQRLWRKDPNGKDLGRSDFDGVEGLMDALDETWSSWMRDLRLGKARIVTAQSLLEDLGPGKGSALDLDREVWAPVNAMVARDGHGLPIQQVQFAIRVDEHQRTATELLDAIRRTAGYSSQTFGDVTTSLERTATEVQARERRSYLTRDRKVRAFTPAVKTLVSKMLAIDTHVLGQPGLSDQVRVTFADGVSESTETLARTATLLAQAEAASTATKVALVHPDWDTSQVDAEVTQIRQDTGAPVADPLTIKA